MKRVLTVIAAIVAAATVSHAQPSASMSLIHHNIHSGGQPQAAANHIADLLNLTPQKALVLLNEANYARPNFTLPFSGWQHIWPSSPFEGRGNPTFTRSAAATVLSSWALPMDEPWTYNGNNRDPRVYTVVKCQLVSQPWVQFHCVNIHFPPATGANGVSRQESVDRLIELSGSLSDLPLIICGDFNMEAPEVKTRIADPIGGKVHSNAKVDHMIVRDGASVGFNSAVEVIRMGQFISDHQALRYNFSFKLLDKVIDNSGSGFTASATWSTGTSAADKYGSNYRFRQTGPVSDPAKWTFTVPVAGNYEIYAWWSQGANRSTTAPYILPNGSTINKNQQTNGGSWQSLGTHALSAGTHEVKLSCWTTNGAIVVGDAIKVVPR